MLTTVDYSDAAGVSGIEWDAVEVASQFMENWCYHKPTLIGMTTAFRDGRNRFRMTLFDKICRRPNVPCRLDDSCGNWNSA
jgi:oligopeptidase A